MGIPAPVGVAAVGTPPTGDQANCVLTGSFAAVGVSACVALLGPFNYVIWGTVNTALTTTAASSNFSVASGTGLAVGQGVNSGNVPPGTTILTFSGTSGTLAFPPGITNASVKTGVDAAATFGSVAWAGTVQLERSFDGGTTFFVCNTPTPGAALSFSGATQAGVAVNGTLAEVERQVLYRFNCVLFTSGVINYRLSATGAGATAWGVLQR